MKKNTFKILSFIALIAFLFTSCEEQRITLDAEVQVGFEKSADNLLIPKDNTTTFAKTFRVMLIAPAQNSDVQLTIAVDTDESTAVEGTHFNLSATTLTIPAGEFFAEFDVVGINDGFAAGGDFVNLVLEVTSSNVKISPNFTVTNIELKKESFTDKFSGTYTVTEWDPTGTTYRYGPYNANVAPVAGTNDVTTSNFYDWAQEDVEMTFSDDGTITIALQPFRSNYTVDGTGNWNAADDNDKNFTLDVNIYLDGVLDDQAHHTYVLE